MVHPVTLSDPAFKRLRQEKRQGESDSDVVLRLADEAARARKRPESFVGYKPKRAMSVEAQLRLIQAMNKDDQVR